MLCKIWVKVEGIPNTVVQVEDKLDLCGLSVTRKDSKIEVSVQYSGNFLQEYAIVSYFNLSEIVIVMDIDHEGRFIAYSPNIALIPPEGFKKGGNNKGKIEFTLDAEWPAMFGRKGYNLSGQNGTVFVFAVLSKGWSDGDQIESISNIIKKDVSF